MYYFCIFYGLILLYLIDSKLDSICFNLSVIKNKMIYTKEEYDEEYGEYDDQLD